MREAHKAHSAMSRIEGKGNLAGVRWLEHDPEKLQTFRTRSCSKINEVRARCDSTYSHRALSDAGHGVGKKRQGRIVLRSVWRNA
jgi:hypothetical protein